MRKNTLKIIKVIFLFLILIFSHACTTAKCEVDRQVCKFNCPETILLKQACEIGCDYSYDVCREGGSKKEETPSPGSSSQSGQTTKDNQDENNQIIKTDKNAYSYGENIQVYYYNAPGDSRDWICIVPAGSPDREAGDWKYIHASGNGVLIFESPQPGDYEARAFYQYKTEQYDVTARYRFKGKVEDSYAKK